MSPAASALAVASEIQARVENETGGLMIRAGTFRGKQQKNKINRLIVDCLEIDRMGETGKETLHLVNVSEFAVRYGHTLAKPC